MKKSILIIIGVLIIGLGIWHFASKPKVENVPTGNSSIEYKNTDYGFIFKLPVTWKGYSIINEKWAGILLDSPDNKQITGAKISIRHPLWTKETPRQDIPIMIFTADQWNLIQKEKLSVGAAPIGPSELGHNGEYVFALPARYNFAFPTGFEEVEKIIESKPLTPIASPITYTNSSKDLIRVELPFPGAVTGKNFSVIGEARGYWYFEASFPIDLLDKDGNLLMTAVAQAQEEWMTENFVPFRADFNVPASYIGPATLVLKKDNPSGLPEHDASISFPITIEY